MQDGRAAEGQGALGGGRSAVREGEGGHRRGGGSWVGRGKLGWGE